MPLIVRPGRPATHHAIAGSVFATARPAPGGVGDPGRVALGIGRLLAELPSIDLEGVRMVRGHHPYGGV
ncbi:hypothetical protein [Micromonospora sp. NPDC007230]|uniref:hypothetical protein n=1 Tax=Micromonospora sp. NPDC007230 TaxID=3364237 RepID=UPI00367FD020